MGSSNIEIRISQMRSDEYKILKKHICQELAAELSGAKVCKNCKHFYQHYIKEYTPGIGEHFHPTNCGHCAEPRIRSRKPNASGCAFFEFNTDTLISILSTDA